MQVHSKTKYKLIYTAKPGLEMKRLVLFVCLLPVVSGVRAATQYRDFTSAEGKTIRGCIKAYNAAKKMVTIERDNRKTAKVPITIFSETDQTYIHDWKVLKCFEKESSFRISVKRKKHDNDEEREKTNNTEKDVTDTHYEILVENKSAFKLKGIELEYCIYYEQEEGKACNQGVYCGDLSVESINPASSKTLLTEVVSTYTEELDGSWHYISGESNVQRGDVHGVWIRIHLKLPSGQNGIREICYPDSLNNNRAWVSSSIRAGMN